MNRTQTWIRSRDPLFILSFPAAGMLGITVQDMVTDAASQVAAMEEIRNRYPQQTALTGLMDLSLEAEAFGCPVRFSRDDLPVVMEPVIRNPEDARNLQIPAPDTRRLAVTLEALQTVRKRNPDTPLLAGCIGPFSLAGRLADPSAALTMPVTDPGTLTVLLDKAATFLISLLEQYRKAGCDGVIMAEPMAGLMSPAMNRKFVLPWLQKIIVAVQTDAFAVVLHNCGPSAGKCWNVLRQSGAAAYHFGNAVDLSQILETHPDVPVFGNLDPVAFVTEPPETIASMTGELIRRCGIHPCWRLSSGCDIPAAARPDSIQAAFDTWNRTAGQ